MNKGWIKLHRQIQDCWMWECEKFDKAHAFIDLILLANHADKKISINGKPTVISRGQFFTSRLKLAERWRWNVKKVDRFLNDLEYDQTVSVSRSKHGITVSIVNYSVYQEQGGNETDNGEDNERDNRRDNRRDTNKNDKELKNERNIYNVQFEEFWKFYPRHEDKGRAYQCYKARLNAGYSEDELLTACKNYADECEREGREKRYIKLATTFLSINEPFRDYLEKGETVEQGLGDSFTGNAKRDAEIDEIIRHLNDDDDDEELWQSLRKV